MTGYSVKLFYSYCHADESHRQDMEKYLTLLKKDGILKEWCDRKLLAGQKFTEVIKKELNDADIIVFLVSIDFLNSDACKEEWELANTISKNSKKHLISIILRECPWTEFDDMGDHLALPTDGKPVTSWHDKDSAWCDVYKGIKNVVNDVRNTFNIKDDFKNKISLLEFCSQSNEELSINDLFVFPNLAKQSEFTEEEHVVRSLSDLLKEKKTIIQGDVQSGKTKLCSHVFLELVEKNEAVLLVDLNDIANKKASLDVFQKCYSDQHQGDFNLWLNRNNKTCIFDNLSNFKYSLEYVFLAENYFDRVIVTTSNENYDSYFKDDSRLSGFSSIIIKPFTHIKQESLIRKWLSLKSKSYTENIEHGQIDQIENNINAIIIDNKILPRYPFFILSILQTYESFMPQDLKITAYGHCYYALIIAHLIKSGIAQEDNSISTCFNYANQLAIEMYVKNPTSLILSYEDYEAFKKSYKQRFIIKDSLIYRLQSQFGIIKEIHGKGFKFSLSYSYYYFLGQYLAANHKDNKKLVSSLIEKSYQKDNSLTLIFTIHHAQDLEVIDEILTHTICAFDKIEPAKLDKNETDIFRDLLSIIPKKIVSDQAVNKERHNKRRFRDKVESESLMEMTEADSGDEFLNQIYQCHKNIEILSQILKNKYGNLEKQKIIEIVEIICDAGLRLVKMSVSENNKIEDLVATIYKKYIESNKYDAKKSQDEVINDIRTYVILKIFIWVITNIEMTVSSINKPEINEIIDEIKNHKETPAYDVIHYFYSLDTANKFDDNKKYLLEELLEKYDEKTMFFVHKILSIRTQVYINTHTIKAPIKQAVSSLLKIEYKP
ncbi:MAG: TIR domain-containing protein [Methylococcaceae bacterium]